MRLHAKDKQDSVGVHIEFLTPERDDKILSDFKIMQSRLRQGKMVLAESMIAGRWRIVVKQGKVFFLQKHDASEKDGAPKWIVEFSIQNHRSIVEIVSKVLVLPRHKHLSSADMMTWFGVREPMDILMQVVIESAGKVAYYITHEDAKLADGVRVSAELARTLNAKMEKENLVLVMDIPLIAFLEPSVAKEVLGRSPRLSATRTHNTAGDNYHAFRQVDWMPTALMDKGDK